MSFTNCHSVHDLAACLLRGAKHVRDQCWDLELVEDIASRMDCRMRNADKDEQNRRFDKCWVLGKLLEGQESAGTMR